MTINLKDDKYFNLGNDADSKFKFNPSTSKILVEGSTPWHFTRSGDVYDVKAHGAIGDGITDDTSAIQSAMTTAAAAGGGIIMFPAGSYVISSPITVPSYSTIHGVAPEFVVGGVASGGSRLVASSTALTSFFSLENCSYTRIEDLSFIAATPVSSNSTSAIQDDAGPATYITIHNCRFKNFNGDCIRLSGNVQHISYNSVRDTGAGAIINLAGSAARGYASSDNIVTFNDIGGQNNSASYGIVIGDFANGWSSENNLIEGNRIFNCGIGIYLRNSLNNRIIGNRVEKHELHGIQDDIGWNQIIGNHCFNNGAGIGAGNSSGVHIKGRGTLVEGNRCNEEDQGSGKPEVQKVGILLNGAQDATVIGNHIEDSTLYGIYASGANRYTLEGNRIFSVYEHGIYVANNALHGLITSNSIYNAGVTAAATYYGIRVEASTYHRIANNIVRQSATTLASAISVTGDDNIVDDNDTGPTAYASGTAVINSGSNGVIHHIDASGGVNFEGGATAFTTYRRANTAFSTPGQMIFQAHDSVNAKVAYAHLTPLIITNTAGAHDGQWLLKASVSGTITSLLQIDKDGVDVIGGVPFRISGTTLFESDGDLAVSLLPNVDKTLNMGSSSMRFATAYLQKMEIHSTDANDGILFTNGQFPHIRPNVDTAAMLVGGGDGDKSGGSIFLSGEARASNAGQVNIRYGGETAASAGALGGYFRVSANQGSSTDVTILNADISGNVNIATGAFQVGGTTVFESDLDLAIAPTPNADGTLDIGTASRRWLTLRSKSAILYSVDDANHALSIQRFSASGRAQVQFQDESGNQLWRMGLTGSGSDTFLFYDGTQNAISMARTGDLTLSPGGVVNVTKNFQIGSTTLFESDRDLAVDLLPNADNTLDLGSSARRFSDGWFANTLTVGTTSSGEPLRVSGSGTNNSQFFRTTSTVGDAIQHLFTLWNSVGSNQIYGLSRVKILTNTAGAADGQYLWATVDAGTITDHIKLDKNGLDIIGNIPFRIDGTTVIDTSRNLVGLSVAQDLNPEADGTRDLGSTALRYAEVHSQAFQVEAAASDANPVLKISSSGIQLGAGGASALDTTIRRLGADQIGLAAASSAPADGTLQASEIVFTLDETNHELEIKVKYSDGTTVKTGTVALS